MNIPNIPADEPSEAIEIQTLISLLFVIFVALWGIRNDYNFLTTLPAGINLLGLAAWAGFVISAMVWSVVYILTAVTRKRMLTSMTIFTIDMMGIVLMKIAGILELTIIPLAAIPLGVIMNAAFGFVYYYVDLLEVNHE